MLFVPERRAHDPSRRVVEEMGRMEMELKDAQAKNRALAEYVDDRAAAPRKEAKGCSNPRDADTSHPQLDETAGSSGVDVHHGE